MTRRFPRQPVRHPRNEVPKDFDCKDIDKATRSNGSVDLNKIREAIDERKEYRRSIARKINKTKDKHKKVFDKFLEIYEEEIGIKYIPNKKNRYVTFKNKEGKSICRRYRTDFVRMSEVYDKVVHKYKITVEMFFDYLLHAIKTAVLEFEAKKQNQIFGIVISDGVIEHYFTKVVMKKHKVEKKKKREKNKRTRHLKYFK